MNKRITELPGNETKWIRYPGLLMGVAGILVLPYMFFNKQVPIHMALGGMFICAIFILYGAGGSKLLFKYMYTTKVRWWKLW